MGLAQTLVQRKNLRPDHVATAFFSALVMAVVAGAGMWFAASLIADVMQIPELTQANHQLAVRQPAADPAAHAVGSGGQDPPSGDAVDGAE